MEPSIKTKLLIYSSFLFILFLHFLLKFKFSEPYPSLIFPSFSKAPDKPGEYDVVSKDVFAITLENDTLDVDEKKYFKGVYSNHVPFLISRLKQKSQNKAKSTANRERAEFINYSFQQLNEQYPKAQFKTLMILVTKTVYTAKKGLVSKQVMSHQKTFIDLQ